MIFIKFVICLILYEGKIIKKKLKYIIYIFYNLNIIDYLTYKFFDRKINPMKCQKFKKFIKENKKKWNKINLKNINIDNNNLILIDNFINQAQFSLNQISVGKYLSYFYRSNCAGLLIKGDIKGEILFRSFGINKFYHFSDGNIIERCKYLIKALMILKKVKNIKEFCNIKEEGIEIGLTSYDTFIRYTRIPSTNKINSKMTVFLAQALFANNYFNKLFKKKYINKLVQAEKQFIPLSILFQNALKMKKTIFIRTGINKISVKIYNKFNQRHENKITFSIKLLKCIIKENKLNALKLIDKFYKIQFKNKLYGRAWAHYIGSNKKIISIWKNTEDPNFINKSIKINQLISIDKKDMCKINNWDDKKKIVTVFLPYMIDGNFQHGMKKLYKDNFSWTINTLNLIKEIKNVNWLIRQHPNEERYNSKINFNEIMNEIEIDYKHIKLVPKNINPTSIINITDVAVTSHGSVGLEYPSFGKQCIVGENSFYTHYGFNILPSNINEYKKILSNIDKIKKINKKNIEKAKAALFIFLILTRIRNTIIPEPQPIFEARMRIKDESLYWGEAYKKLKLFNFLKDDFKIMLGKQILHKSRHTLNTKHIKFKNKIFNDF
jgi:hypothetical protein